MKHIPRRLFTEEFKKEATKLVTLSISVQYFPLSCSA
ncbi:hypothetical protein MCEREM3_00438 [Methylophilaceae bacterium]